MKYHIFQNAFRKWRWYLMKGKDRIATGESYNTREACEEAMADNKASGSTETEESGLPLEKGGGGDGNPPSKRETRLN